MRIKYILVLLFIILLPEFIFSESFLDSFTEYQLLNPTIEVYLGFQIGSQSILSTPLIGISAGMAGIRLGVEGGIMMFVAGWGSIAWYISYDIGLIEVGHKFAYSFIGAGYDSDDSFISKIFFLRITGYDDAFNTIHFTPLEFEISYTYGSTLVEGQEEDIHNWTHPNYFFKLPITIGVYFSGILWNHSLLGLPPQKNNEFLWFKTD